MKHKAPSLAFTRAMKTHIDESSSLRAFAEGLLEENAEIFKSLAFMEECIISSKSVSPDKAAYEFLVSINLTANYIGHVGDFKGKRKAEKTAKKILEQIISRSEKLRDSIDKEPGFANIDQMLMLQFEIQKEKFLLSDLLKVVEEMARIALMENEERQLTGSAATATDFLEFFSNFYMVNYGKKIDYSIILPFIDKCMPFSSRTETGLDESLGRQMRRRKRE